MRNRVETAWIMAEIERYSFEPMRDSWQSEEDDVHGSQDERRRENTSWCNASVVRTGKLQNFENAYAARKSRKQLAKVQVNNKLLAITGYCCIQPQMLIILALGS